MVTPKPTDVAAIRMLGTKKSTPHGTTFRRPSRPAEIFEALISGSRDGGLRTSPRTNSSVHATRAAVTIGQLAESTVGQMVVIRSEAVGLSAPVLALSSSARQF
jgi:hypothetical protein